VSTAAELVILGDLHLGRGKNPRTGRWHELEAFFYDDDFGSFCDHLRDDAAARHVQLRVILVGDVFDLLRVDSDLDEAGPPRFEPVSSPAMAAELVGAILAGRPGVVAGLARLLTAGHELVVLPGNHDIELQWTAPQE
jgi:UDP-2,3-diacylglucosamine pyrophosphatase LpxH